MLVPFSWLLDFVDYEGSPRDASRVFTLSGTNIESVEGDVLEAEVTPNRGDCLSVIGLARELSAAAGTALNVSSPKPEESGDPASASVSVEIQAPDLCPRYSARYFRNVKIGPSPDWIQQRLIAAGLRPINVAVDITNYVMLEYGQPLHAFDYEQVKDGRIIVRRANEGETFITLDEVERKLDSSMLLICDAERPVAIAGVMGGQNSEISDETTAVLLESAYFDPMSVRATSKKLGLSTDSSYRFERGVDPSGTVAAADRAAQLFQELAGAEVAPGVVDVYPAPIKTRTVYCRPERVNRLVGQAIPVEDQKTYLERLDLKTVERDGKFVVTIPTFRPDLVQEDDIVEEVARIYGYDKIVYRLPNDDRPGRLSDTQAFVNRVRQLLRGCGLQEVLTHSYTNPAQLARFKETAPVRLQNPISEEYATLRTTLLPLLAAVAERNARHGRRDINIFEVGQVFLMAPEEKIIREPQRAAGLLCGSRMAGRWNLKPVPLEADFYAAKGVVEAVLDALRIPDAGFLATSAPGLHPGRTACITVGEVKAGWIGQIDPALQEEMELPGPTYVFELDLDVLEVAQQPPTAHALPRYPGVARDIAMLVPKSMEAGRVRNVLMSAAGPYLEDATLFDVYEGKGVPEDQKSLAFALRFRSPERTLTDEEIDGAVQKIRATLSDEVGATAR